MVVVGPVVEQAVVVFVWEVSRVQVWVVKVVKLAEVSCRVESKDCISILQWA